jgi:serine protease Do
METISVEALEAALARVDKGKSINVLFRRGDWAQYTLIKPAR